MTESRRSIVRATASADRYQEQIADLALNEQLHFLRDIPRNGDPDAAFMWFGRLDDPQREIVLLMIEAQWQLANIIALKKLEGDSPS